ncbi:Spermidine/putrescine-binding periplasmic protein [Saezia sanguinis]|uniref:Spermidine/putrescine-binding periplasmic protein n=1 Tax=Saezia sanguinis TaxID=1965230 RepID=A0A433SHB2_9BURK|nr:ABC transporter substrate-binding protein [Saezia sanguinis]RUS68135.1 Spermidine/putrescine-binding periplasmic protein [Saezia sanguinis]
MKRRSFLKTSSTFALALGAPAIIHAQSKQFEGITLNINGYGGDFSRILTEYVSKPLEEKTGLKVSYQDGTASAAVAKLLASRNNPPFDIIMADSPNIPELMRSDIIEPITNAEIPNSSKLLPGVREFGDFGMPFLTNAVVLTYNSKHVKQPVTSYADLARADLKGRVGWMSPSHTAGLLALIALGEANGGTLDNMEPAFKALAAMKDNISMVSDSTVSMVQLFEQEEVWAGAFWDGRVYSMRNKGFPMESVLPKEGAYGLFNYLAPVKGTRKKDAVLAYINQALSDEAANALVEFFRYAPCTNLELAPEVAKDVVVYGKDRSMLKPIDWDKVSQIRGQLLEQFNKAVR